MKAKQRRHSGAVRVSPVSGWKTKRELVSAINTALRQQRLSQPAAAAVLHMPQPAISALMHYKLNGFSVQRLIRILNGLGKDVVIQVADNKGPGTSGTTSVRAA
jgi:predicted XRE-type DNA-binding protein